MNFIYTTSEETREKLLKLGFKEIKTSGSYYMFENDPSILFCKKELDRVVFSNTKYL